MVRRLFSGRSRRLSQRPGLLTPGLGGTPRRLFRRRRFHPVRLTMTVLGLLALVWGVGFVAFAASVPREPNNAATRADAVVVLTGGRLRVSEGMRLLSEDRGTRLLITGVFPETSRDALLTQYGGGRGDEIACCVDLDRVALDTRGNAIETRRWVNSHGFSSLIVVTSNYHMPRTLLELRRVLPEVTLIAHPVFPEGFSPTAKWDWTIAGRLLVGEYMKFIASYLLPGR